MFKKFVAWGAEIQGSFNVWEQVNIRISEEAYQKHSKKNEMLRISRQCSHDSKRPQSFGTVLKRLKILCGIFLHAHMFHIIMHTCRNNYAAVFQRKYHYEQVFVISVWLRFSGRLVQGGHGKRAKWSENFW